MATEQTAQKVIREKGQTTCVYHKGQSLIMYCETCSDVMCVKCLSGLHKGHLVCDLNEVLPSMKKELQSYLNKNNRAQIQKELNSTENEMKKNLNNFDSLCHEVETQSVKLKQAIDLKKEKVLEFCKQMTEGNIKTLTCATKELQSQLKCFDDNLQQEYTEVLKNGSSLQVHDTLDEVRSRPNLQQMPILATASFRPNTNPQSYMDRYFGTITSSAYRPLQYTLLPNTIELSTFDLDSQNKIQAICASTEDEAWVVFSGEYHNGRCEIKLINTNGDVQQTIPWELPILDASVSPTTKNLWVCSMQAVYELDVSNKSSASLLKTHPTVHGSHLDIKGLCVTMDDQVIVGCSKNITKYTKDGKLMFSTKQRQSGKPLVGHPTKIAECCVTRNVAVISSKRSVVVMAQDFEEIFEQSSKNKQLGDMRDLQYDTAGNLIICCDSYLHVLNGRGEFLKDIVTQPYLMAVSLDTDGVLWTGCDLREHYSGASFGIVRNDRPISVKRLQYCKQNVV